MLNCVVLMGALKRIDESKNTMTLDLTQDNVKKEVEVLVPFMNTFVDTEDFNDGLPKIIIVRGHLDSTTNGIIPVADRISIEYEIKEGKKE